MVDSQDLKIESYNEEAEVASDEEMFPLTGNSQQLQQQPSNYELKDWDSQTMELFNSQTFADDASKVLRCGDFATGSQDYELPISLKSLENLAPGESINVEVFNGQVDDTQPTTTTNLDHLRQFPSVDPMIVPWINFQVSLPSETSDKTSWMFSRKLQKLFVKMGNTCTFNVSQLPSPDRDTTVRAMVVCSTPEDRHLPVSRCDNHRCSDNQDIPDSIKTHIVRCKNEQVTYTGTKDGKTFEERLAVLVPMGHSAKTGITLEFVCQNSCRNINRRATALVFTLEDQAGRILGRQVFQIKICTNIKRDMVNEEKAVMEESSRKRKAAAQSWEHKRGKKIVRYHSGLPLSHSQTSAGIQIKEESGNRRCNIDPVTFTVTMPNRRMARRMLDIGIGQISTAVVNTSNDAERNELMQFVHDIRRIKSSFALPNSQSSVDSD
ncbi:cellular tumor antigen p53 isoform X1 [Aedes aegypti]|uniref:p53 DNA-binding domain-containing protein n=1 Tax=Aedes aegypti TaxID=7159 RepID=A0A0P6IUF5_AEDAE|nr:cellular tumor antigen p53 isoform X1 [Aedes aegypti]XP_021694052.1 cellular tumor antigen p53 isoform X1 [Aedes aegypti]